MFLRDTIRTVFKYLAYVLVIIFFRFYVHAYEKFIVILILNDHFRVYIAFKLNNPKINQAEPFKGMN